MRGQIEWGRMALWGLAIVGLIAWAGAASGEGLGARGSGRGAVLVEFYGERCIPCRQMEPIVQRLERDGVKVDRINTDRQPKMAEKWSIELVPTFLVVGPDGEEVERIVGKTSYERLAAAMGKVAGRARGEGRGTRDEGRSGPDYRSVVRVRTNDTDGANSNGSGVAIARRGVILVVTCAHNVREARRVFVEDLDGRWHNCSILARRRDLDVAVLQPFDQGRFQPAKLAAGELQIGETLISAGFGHGRLAINRGRFQAYRGTETSVDQLDWIEIDGFSRDGDSGGPVFNGAGELVSVLWGSNNGDVLATRPERVRELIDQAAAKAVAPEASAIAKRNPAPRPSPPAPKGLVPVRRADGTLAIDYVAETGWRSSGQRQGLLPICRRSAPAPQPQPRIMVAPPQVNIEADPRVGDSLERIDYKTDVMNQKLDVVVEQTAPPPEPASNEPNPAIMILVVGGMVVIGFVAYFATQKG